MKERAALFGSGELLIGVVTEPSPSYAEAGLPAAIILNSGLVHRVGINRISVRMARGLAAKGHLAFRFDFSGIGDSIPATDHRSMAERWIAETRAAMSYLAETANTDRFLLLGNCSGAAISYLTAHADPRVVGLGLINPLGPLLLRHFLRTALTHPATWRRLLTGRARIQEQIRFKQLFSRRTQEPPPQHYDLSHGVRTLAERGVELLLIYSQWDPSYDFFQHALRRELTAAGVTDNVQVEIVPGADHQLSLLSNQERLLEIVGRWAEAMGMARWN